VNPGCLLSPGQINHPAMRQREWPFALAEAGQVFRPVLNARLTTRTYPLHRRFHFEAQLFHWRSTGLRRRTDTSMADDTVKNSRSADEQSLHTHLCEHPGCPRWGGLGYDVEMGQTQWFCGEHKWDDYRLGKSRLTWPDINTSNMSTTGNPVRAVLVR
jgi:hypothetical protein